MATPTKAITQELADEFSSLDIITFAESDQYCAMGLTRGQRTILKTAYGLPLDPAEMKVYTLMTGGGTWVDVDGQEYAPQYPRTVEAQHGLGTECEELLLVCGRRSGKSLAIASIMALYESCCRAHIWTRYLMPGEQGYAIVVATRQDQAKEIIQKQCANILKRSPRLSLLLDEEPKALQIPLINGMVIMSLPCSSTAGRGIPVYFLCLDEAAHFRFEGKTTDRDVYDSIEPAMTQFYDDTKPDQPKPKLVFATSPAAKQGLVWEWFTEGSVEGSANFTVDRRVTIQAPTRLVNERVSTRRIATIRRRNPDNCAREYDAQFVERMSAFFPPSLGLAYTVPGDLPYKPSHTYCAGMDQSGLSGRDHYAFAIAHQEPGGELVVDCVRMWETQDLDEIMGELVALCARYAVVTVMHDRYAAGWVTNALARRQLVGETSPTLPLLYTNAKGLAIAQKLKLPDTAELRNGMANTMAVYGSNSALSIFHERDAEGHSDLADAVCRAVYSASEEDQITEDVIVFDTSTLVDELIPLDFYH